MPGVFRRYPFQLPRPAALATLTSGGGAAAALEGTATLALSASADLTTGIALASTASLAVTTAGALTTAIPLAGASSLALTTTGVLTRSRVQPRWSSPRPASWGAALRPWRGPPA